MLAILLSLLLALQPTFTNQPPAAPPAAAVQPRQLWWGMIDPELSAWFARVPDEEEDNTRPILWNWSWRSFWAALTSQPIVKEAAHASHL